MKYIIFTCLIATLSVLAFGARAEQISDFSSELRITPAGSVEVREHIQYDFGPDEHHGIFRLIPFKYKVRGGNFAVRIHDISVTDAAGTTYPASISRQGNYLYIKIGDPDVFVSGVTTYRIKYTVDRAINFFDNHDELYWNVTGTEWHVPIAASSAVVHIPPAALEQIDADCYTGNLGSTEQNCEITVAPHEVTYRGTGSLMPSEGLTIVLGLPKGTITPPSTWQEVLWFIEDNGIAFLPLIVLIIMGFLWRQRGRDAGEVHTIIPEYEPPDAISPSEAGALLDEKVNGADISVILISLAAQGYIKIRRVEKKRIIGSTVDYELTRLKCDTGTLPAYESLFFSALFSDDESAIMLSDLKDSFYVHIPKIKEAIYNSLVSRKYFHKSPAFVRAKYMTIAGILGVAGFLFSPLGAVYPIAITISAVIIFIFSFHMPAATIAGRRMKEKTHGYKLFLSVTEKDRAAFHFDPKKNPELFAAYLPYAIVFGVERAWAKQFEGIVTTPPPWYESDATTFNPVVFSGIMHDFNRSTLSTAMSTPSSHAAGGGSGFSGGSSGGGFGGGGGGSW